MLDIESSLPASKRTILPDFFKVGRSHEDHTYESCRSIWSGLPLLTAVFVLVLAICGCGSGGGAPISGGLLLTPGTLQFGDVLVGGQANTNVDIANHGPEAVVLSQVKIAGQTFSVVGGGGLPVSIPSGGTHTLRVGFAPVSAGNYSGALSLMDASSKTIAQAAIYGHGSSSTEAPQLSLSAPSLSFGNIAVNGTARETLTLKSTGTQPITINSAATSAGSFSVNGASFPMTLNPGQSMTVAVQFEPKAVGVASGQLSINSNSSTGQTTVVALSGTGTATAQAYSQLTASTSSLSFGSVTVGASVAERLILRSIGTLPVTVNSASISGAAFKIVGGSFPVTLNPGQSATVAVQFEPTTAAAASGQLSINSNSSAGATTVVALSGTGIAAANPQLTASAKSLSFGSVTVGTSAPQSLTLRSTGTSPVTVNSASISGAAFKIAGSSFPVTLNPGQSVTLMVQFEPTTAAAASGQLSINSNSLAGATMVVALSGTGIAANPELTANATSVNFGSVAVSVATTSNLKLSSTGSTPVTVNSARIQGAGFTIVGGSFPVTLNPGQTLSLVLQFQPTVAGAATGQLTITSNSLSGGSMVVPLSGLATAVAHEVDLSWLPPASSPDPVVGYNIYRSVSGGQFVRLNSAVSPPTTYVDSTVVSSVSYSYVAKSVDANGVESTASNEYQVTIP